MPLIISNSKRRAAKKSHFYFMYKPSVDDGGYAVQLITWCTSKWESSLSLMYTKNSFGLGIEAFSERGHSKVFGLTCGPIWFGIVIE